MTNLKSIIILNIVLLFCLSLVIGEFGLEENEYRMGSYGYECTSDCKKRGYDYYWCHAKHPDSKKHYKGDYYWDYCSKKEGFDYKGVQCYIEHACGNHGYKYKWCYTSEDLSSWGYCGYNWKKED